MKRLFRILTVVAVISGLAGLFGPGRLAQAAGEEHAGGFIPLQARILDSRTGLGGWTTPIQPGEQRQVPISGVAGIPSSGVDAVAITLTSVSASGNGWLSVGAAGSLLSGSALTYNLGDSVSSAAIVKVGTGGAIAIKAGNSATALIIDVQGYFAASADDGYVSLDGKRVADTRIGLNAPLARLQNGSNLTISLASLPDLSNERVTAVFVTVTVINPAAPGWLIPYPANTVRPTGVSINFDGPQNSTALSSWVKVTDSQGFTIGVGAGGSLDLAVDISGYTTTSATDGSAAFTAASARLFDSRSPGSSPIPAGGTVSVPVAGLNGVPAAEPGSLSAAVSITTVTTQTTAAGYLRAWPSDQEDFETSALNYDGTNMYRTASTIVALSANDGSIRIENVGSSPITVVVDLQGWFQRTRPDPLDTIPAGDLPPLGQEALVDFNTWIGNLPANQRDGYVQSIDFPSTNTVQLDWHGDQTKAAAIVAEGVSRGLVVTLRSAPYSVAQLEAMAEAAFKITTNPTGQRISVVTARLLPEDGGSPVLETTPAPDTSPSVTPAQAASSTPQAPAVSYRFTESATVPLGRGNDFAPFHGGAFIRKSGGGYCSTGFNIYLNGLSYTTTARHCTGTWYAKSASNKYGTAGSANVMGAARMPSRGTTGVWVGPARGATVASVVGIRTNQGNDLVCTSGGNSGQRCWLRVVAGWTYTTDGYGSAFRVKEAHRTSAGSAAAHGDSGGPVLMYTRSPRPGVLAVGMIQSAAGAAYAPGSNACMPLQIVAAGCYSGVLYSDMQDILRSWPGSSLHR